jgi:Uma2 family endonuclease
MAVELIDGEAVVLPPSGAAAASVQGELFFALRSWQKEAADRGLLLQDVFVELPGRQFLAPDIASWSAARRPTIVLGAIDVVPDLIVEVLSPATRVNDLGVKRNHYLEVDVRELWLADPSAKTLTRTRPSGGDEIHTEGTLETEHPPGFSVELRQIFRQA